MAMEPKITISSTGNGYCFGKSICVAYQSGVSPAADGTNSADGSVALAAAGLAVSVTILNTVIKKTNSFFMA